MKKIFIAVSGFLIFACTQKTVQTNSTNSHNFTSRSLASEEMQDVMVPETVYNEKIGADVACPISEKLNYTQDKNKRFDILSEEAAAIKATAHMILTSEPKGDYYCDESKMLALKANYLTSRSLCFQLAVAKYYNLPAMMRTKDFAKYQQDYTDKLKNVEKVQKFNRPLSSKCDAEYMKDFKMFLDTAIPLCSFFSN